ncbi:FCD domain-containing protein [Xylophilus rhododendri]|uniref:FCD domain-containing protein n=1 Tax=Xylophilus rhododendri TaxID=2697032 RepID=A0A857J1B9_9BURK|nr:GntR family transcriptional regulator [Xylophilus rhododendri]QHI96675.1 FCD domain-containing protein [Xylophilus rhododendri]
MQIEKTRDDPNASQPDRIRAALLEDIEAGALMPGDPVDEKLLADRFGVSRTPVREALLTLSAQHLVRIVPRSGIHVHAPEAAELVGMLEALSELEGVVARLCAQRMDPAQREGLEHWCAATRASARKGDRAGFEAANQAFHTALYEGCGNSVVVEQVQQLRLRLAAFRRKVRDQPGRLLSSAADHEAVVAAVLASDAERAAQAMREHIVAKGRAFADLLLAPAGGRR